MRSVFWGFFCPWLSLWDWVRGTGAAVTDTGYLCPASPLPAAKSPLPPQPLSCPQAPASPEKPHSLFTHRVSQAPWQGPTFPYSVSAFWLLWHTRISRRVKCTLIIAQFLSAHTFAGALKTYLLQRKNKKRYSASRCTPRRSPHNIFFMLHIITVTLLGELKWKKPSQCAYVSVCVCVCVWDLNKISQLKKKIHSSK